MSAAHLAPHKQLLMATIGLQRFALRSDIALVRASLLHPQRGQGRVMLGLASASSRWLLGRDETAGDDVRWLRVARLGALCVATLSALVCLRRRSPCTKP
ncbi:MAG: hypothetical protein NVS2B4_20860 [Ramlibacter sp.]